MSVKGWIAAIGFMAAALAPAVGGAFEMGPLSRVIEPRRDDVWTIRDEGGAAVFENVRSPNQITYYYVDPQPGDAGRREVSVEVDLLKAGPNSLAGRLYGFEANPKSYFLFTVGGDGSVNLHRFDQGRFEQRLKMTIGGVADGPTTLTIRERGDEIALLVNGVEKSSLGGSSFGHGGVGVVAADVGTYRFADFSITTPEARAPARRPNADAIPTSPANVAAAAKPAVIGEALRVRRAQVIDEQAPFGRTAAFSTVLPVDWKTEGGVQWRPAGGCAQGPSIGWGAKSSDERYSLALLPNTSWGWSNSEVKTGCFQADFADAAQALEFYVSQAQDIQIRLDAATRPPQLQEFARQLQAKAQAGMLQGAQAWADAILVRGQAVEAGKTSDIAILAITTHWRAAQPNGWGGYFQSGGGAFEQVLILSTPEGELETGHPAFAMILNNFRVNPAWNQGVAQWWSRLRGERTRAWIAATDTAAKTNASIGDLIHEGYRKRDGLRDAGQAETVEAIWGVETYATPDGDMAFSNAYEQAWRLDDGSYVLTNDAFFNPDRVAGQGGVRLQPNR